MARVMDLLPGQIVEHPGLSATFIARCAHPVWRYHADGLVLVIWRLDTGDISLDALSPRQEIGDVRPSTPEQLARQLRAAIHGQRE